MSWHRILCISLFVALVFMVPNLGQAAGPFQYRLPSSHIGIDPAAITVVGADKTHSLKPHENMYQIAEKYDLGFWELARYHRNLDHFYLPKEGTIDIPNRWIIPPVTSSDGIIVNAAELRTYRFLPELGQVRTYPIGIGVFEHKTPFGRFQVNSKTANPGWQIPAGLQAKYGMSYMPPGEDNPIGTHWMGLSHYGLHGSHMPYGVGRLVSHGCIRHYNQDIKELFELTPVGTPVQIIYEPVKIGFLKGRVFIEVHEDIYHKITNMLDHTIKLVDDRQLGSRINWTRLAQAVEERNGAPLDITR